MTFLEYGKDDELLVMIDSAILSNIDLQKVIASHIESGKDITVVTKSGIADGHKVLDLAIRADNKGQILDMAVDYAAPAEYEASMDGKQIVITAYAIQAEGLTAEQAAEALGLN
jgi:ADP-glucose pyrophosphorylase